MQVKSLDHVALHVADLHASVIFYRDVLQLEMLPRPAFDFPGAWFRLGTVQELHLIAGREVPVYSHNRGTHFALEVTDAAAWAEHLKLHNADFREPKLRPDGATQIFVTDPDGHYIELCDKSAIK